MDSGTAQVSTRKAPTKPQPRVALWIIIGCAAIVIAAELIAAAGLSKVSRIERRTHEELSAALQLRPSSPGPRKLLVVGNSLLLEGVDFPALRRTLAPAIDAHRVVVEQTSYLDWYYGIRRLLSEGSRPDTIVLKLNAAQLLSPGIRGDYSALHLFAASDLIAVAHDAGLVPTQASSLWFSHYSTFFGSRTEIRKWLIWKLMPSMQQLQPHLARSRPPEFTSEQILAGAVPRLDALHRLAAGYGVRFILLAPAMLARPGELAALVEAGRRASVPVLVPVAVGKLPASEFTDGFHLTPLGARHYTQALAPLLQQSLLNEGGANR